WLSLVSYISRRYIDARYSRRGRVELSRGRLRVIFTGGTSVSSSLRHASLFTPASPRAHVVSHLFKTLPLLGGEHFFQAGIGLLANLIDAGFRLFSQALQLLSALVEYLFHFRFLIVLQLKPLRELLKSITSCGSA